MRILDRYILKKYLSSFVFTLLILIPIAVAIDVSEKVDEFIYHADLTVYEILKDYYLNFIIYYANTFMPLALFIAVIFFTSKLAGNTEIIAINSSRISFTRFLYPYFIGAVIVTVLAFGMNHFVVPKSEAIRTEFSKKYFNNRKYKEGTIKNFSLQLDENSYIFIKTFNLKRNVGYNFSYENYEGLKLKYKLTGDNISWRKKDSTFKIGNYRKRFIFDNKDKIEMGNRMDTVFNFTPKDMFYVDYMAKEMTSDELNEFIEKSQKRGVKNLNAYLVELYKRTSLPVSSFILTLIAVSLASRKRRGGMGANLALGIGLMFVYVFFMKVGEVLGAVAGANSLFMVWLPNLFFGILAIYLYYRAKN